MTPVAGKPDVHYLVDTSAIMQLPRDDVAKVLAPLLNAGRVATCGVLELALLSHVPEQTEYTKIRTIRAGSFRWLATTDADLVRALQVQALLTEQRLAEQPRHHVGWPELIVAAVAERHHVTLLHYSQTFPRIAEVTGQPVEWVIANG